MGLNSYSDYGSGSGNSEQYSPWGSVFKPSATRSSSFIEGVSKDMDAVMHEFRMNGSDSPYDPEEEMLSLRRGLTGMGPSSMYLRQKSWPAPDSSPAVRLPRGRDWPGDSLLANGTAEASLPPPAAATPAGPDPEAITEQQLRVLRSLPNAVLYPLLRELERARRPPRAARRQEDQECRFCKNNGERESYYRSHPLRAGGRVTCPVLRAFVCRRCGACGDSAHTLKYCPLTPADERTKSAAMMRSLRAASGRRRPAPSNDMQDFVMFGETTPSVIADGNVFTNYDCPLDPIWAALEQKLML